MTILVWMTRALTTMCHGITWFHVLCGHADPSLSTLILCHDSILTGDSCLPCVDLAWLPLNGLCRVCREQERRERKHRRRQIALTAYAAFNEQRKWEWDAPDMLVPKNNHTQSNGRRADRRYDDWFEGQDVIEYQSGADGLDMPDMPSKNEMIEKWLDHSDFPTPQTPSSSKVEHSSPRFPQHTSVNFQRSCIPVPARKTTGSKHLSQRQHSHIPVPINRAQKQQRQKPQNELEVADESGSIDGLDLFDRITF